ncbi:efflux RND transporter periplasmic adaptor subunit [Engelhardtia mirabilis]|uniref:Macrolide export protein MacA n=1 Tax=Engelhardtia mirabilis TaxID=2528011 RepID=A0A518BQB5_9BACT|nr:Macrolide export protein MacA [Planctomycetes bacterium Pla133]QDV03494.1 Macrolide export protein MacA [Planctomycetes bacterium Pla86]
MQRLNGFLTLALGLALSAFAYYWLRRAPEPAPEGGGSPSFVLPVTVAEIRRGTLEPSVELAGTVRAARRSRLAFDVAGWLASVQVRDGDRVEAGQELARLDDTSERLALESAQADLLLARAQLSKAEAGTRREVIERLRADVTSAQADLKLAELNVERGSELLQSRVVSAASLDTYVAGRDAAAGALAAAEQALAEAEAGTREEDLVIARAQVGVAEAGVALAQRKLDETRLFAPWAGSVVERLLDEGEFATTGAAVFDLIDLDNLEVALELPAGLAGQLSSGAAVSLQVDGLRAEPIGARIDVVIPVADERSRNFRALVRLSRGDEGFDRLRPGQFARARVDLTPIEDELLVPDDSIRLVDGGEILVIAEPIPGAEPPSGPPTGPPTPWLRATWIPIRRLGSSGGESAVVSLGPPLEPGMDAVLTGVDRAFPGVSLMPSGGAPAAASADAPNDAPAVEADGSER